MAALILLDGALAKDPNFAAALHQRARCLYHLKRAEEALSAFDKALAVAPGDAQSLLCRAVLLRDKRREVPERVTENELVEAWRAALAADGQQVVPRLELAQLHATAGEPHLRDPQAAVRLALDAVRLRDDASARRVLAFCYFQDGRLDDAVAEVEGILRRNPPDRAYYEDMLRRLRTHQRRPKR
jgi:tetratricopeptide (TPR) repeat protein